MRSTVSDWAMIIPPDKQVFETYVSGLRLSRLGDWAVAI
jgi:hypothetical protein